MISAFSPVTLARSYFLSHPSPARFFFVSSTLLSVSLSVSLSRLTYTVHTQNLYDNNISLFSLVDVSTAK